MMPLFLIAAPEGADPALAPFFQGLTVPGSSSSCCSISDCRPANIRTNATHYEAFIDKKTFGEYAPDDWVRVPEGTILHGHDNPTGQAIVCYFQNRILCFVPAGGV